MRIKIKNLVIQPLFAAFCIVLTLLFTVLVYYSIHLPNEISVYEGNSAEISAVLPVSCVHSDSAKQASKTQNLSGYSQKVDLKVFGVFLIKSAKITVLKENAVKVLGTPFGIKIYANGVMVVKTGTVKTKSGEIDVAGESGLKIGDIISNINGYHVTTNEEVAELIEKSNGNPLKFNIIRNQKPQSITVNPRISAESNTYKAGIWVRDSSAGVGTLTFYSPYYQTVGGLGHGVYDADTEQLILTDSGEFVTADIVSVDKGKTNLPGQLNGVFGNEKIADLTLNAATGVYGKADISYDKNELTQIALKQEAVKGAANILCTTDSGGRQSYECIIEKINYNGQQTKNMVIKITDRRLLNKTGGIVQGMSGSPIIQNGKLIGAITHVLVDDPTTGYAIFAENMLETAQSVANENKLKEAS